MQQLVSNMPASGLISDTLFVMCIASRRSVRTFVDNFKKKNIPLHYLFNNAGEWIREDDTYTEDGFQVLHMLAQIQRPSYCCLKLG